MQVKTRQKISRSAVATVLATSTVALGLPTEQTDAAQYFKDVKTTDFFYSAVNELAEKKIVNGYGDGTFRPLSNVTRGEAAKMLALALKLDVANAETTQFKDVKKGDIFYKYIAALANKGIINGYPDGSFKPNEVVQRGAMAKMVALGYEFTLAKNFTHPFKDVDQKHIFNQHIQTLVNLNITKGTSFNTFSPGKAVTRGELATFISRSSKANAGKPIYVVDNIIGNKIYINSVGYTIGANVASYIKVENKSALIGAHVEGTFNGMTLTNVTKLTLNATGNTNSIYTFDGGNSTYNGTLVVNGSYLKFKNWTLNGQTFVSETPRKILAQYNRLSELKLASLASGIIDFTKPTNPDDGNLNDGDNGNLKPGKGTSPFAPYSEKLSPIYKYVDFTNVMVKNLFVEQNRAYVVAQKEIAMVTIRRDVEFAELNFNMRNLYIEGDESLTLYGTHDIATVYKNSFYSVYFNSNSEIDTLIVDNSNGWIDLGDHVIVNNVIIPPKTTPNDIFDDYKNDNDKIGNIEDNTGKEVDRNPIENGVVPDVTKPIVHSLTVMADSNQATATLTVNETGKYHYLVLPENAPAPTVREIVSAASGFSGSGTVTDSEQTPDGRYTTSFAVSGLQPITKYMMYVVHVDDAGNFSTRYDKDFETKDGTPPQILESRAVGMAGGRRIQLNFKPSETGKYYYIIKENQNIDTTITVDDVITLAQKTTTVESSHPFYGAITEEHVVSGFSSIIRDYDGQKIKPNTNYVVYIALVDESGNKSVYATSTTDKGRIPVKTGELDETAPYVTGPTTGEQMKLIPAQAGSLNQFYIYFSEKLDKASAENVTNYQLTGTGIINVPGQGPIVPTKVVYEENANRALITIPSLTGFVNGDTLRVTVLDKVMDTAENKFENVNNLPVNVISPRNYAEYRHSDPLDPELMIKSVTRDAGNTTAKIEYSTSKAGTLYYMVLPNSFDLAKEKITPEDFVKEFESGTTQTKFNKPLGGKYYLEGSVDKLNSPLSASLGDSSFFYKYNTLNPQSFESYSIYMVLKDRSGRLSLIEKKTMIADEKAPEINSFDVRMNDGSDKDGKVIVSSNEAGLAQIAYVEKYVYDLTTNKYILNPDIYTGTALKEFGASSSSSNEQNKENFINAFTSMNGAVLIKDRYLSEGSANNNFDVSFLKPNKEYVVYLAVEDEFKNFTVKASDKTTPLIKEIYTDGIKPTVINNVVYRDLEMPGASDSTFTITFTETIGRVYKHDGPIKDNLDEKSNITTTTSLDSVLVIKDNNGREITSEFSIVSYTEGTASSPQSKLVIKPNTNTNANKDFTVTVNSADQFIANYGNKVPQTIDYKYPGSVLNKFMYARLKETIPGNMVESTTLSLSLDLGILTSLDQEFYYIVVNDTFRDPFPSKSLVGNVIVASNSNSQRVLDGGSVISYGKERIDNLSATSFIKDLNAIQNTPGTTNVFKSGHKVFLFTLDRYGNVVWAVDSNNTANKFIGINPANWQIPTTP